MCVSQTQLAGHHRSTEVRDMFAMGTDVRFPLDATHHPRGYMMQLHTLDDRLKFHDAL